MLTIPVDSQDHVQGDINAPLMLVEYGDYECPHCRLAHPIVKRLQKRLGTKLGYVFRNFPLNQIHPYAEIAAESAEFAASHGQFWPMHDAIFERQDELGAPMLLELVEGLGLSNEKLRLALEEGTFKSRVRADFMGGVRSGVNGTPTFFVDGLRYDGTLDERSLEAVLRQRIAERA